MTHKHRFFLLAVFMSMVTHRVWANTAKIDGIYYNFSDSKAEVTYGTTTSNSYSGDVAIPATVTYNGSSVTFVISPFASASCRNSISVGECPSVEIVMA